MGASYGPTGEQGYYVEYLLVGGGGGGGHNDYDDGAGGGAGGYRSSIAGNPSANYGLPEPAYWVASGVTYQVTVGAGGISLNNGAYSAFGEVVAAGGGGAGSHRNSGYAGGSGGGGCGLYTGSDVVTGGYGYYGQGNRGGTKTDYPGGSGGGGAAAEGEGGSGTSKDGGAGVWSNVEIGIPERGFNETTNGIGTYRAGGGGGYNGGSGGSGGGGVGWTTGSYPTSGGTNTGGGGGGGKSNHAYSAYTSGGSGIVILRIANADYTGTTTGSPTVTTVDGFKILKFTSSGSYTA
jgi:hypothetical protein